MSRSLFAQFVHSNQVAEAIISQDFSFLVEEGKEKNQKEKVEGNK